MSLALQHLAPTDSVIAGFDPRWKLAVTILAVVGVSLLQDFPAILLSLVFGSFLAYLAAIPRGWLMVRLGILFITLLPFLCILPFTVDRGGPRWEWHYITLSLDGVVVALCIMTRTLTMVTLVLVLLGSTPVHRLGQAASHLGIPRLFIHLFLLTYRYLFLLAEELDRIRVALRLRGFRNRANRHSYRTVSHVLGTLIVRGADRAERVSEALRCRGFHGQWRSLDHFRTTGRDLLLTGIYLVPTFGLVAWDRLL